MLQNNGGKRISRNNRDMLVGHSGRPTDLRVITAEIVLDNSYTYPNKFSLMCASMYAGEKGEEGFTLKISSNSKVDIKEIPNDPEYIE